MLYLGMCLFVALITVLDQVFKAWIVANIPLGGSMSFLPGLMHLTYTQNTGAAFSSFEGARWLFVVVFVAFIAIVVWSFKTNKLPFTLFEKWCIAAIVGGGVGNLIDRIRLGYVVDMFATDFMRFAVFNVADSFITVGGVALVIHLIFWNRDFWKDEK